MALMKLYDDREARNQVLKWIRDLGLSVNGQLASATLATMAGKRRIKNQAFESSEIDTSIGYGTRSAEIAK